MKILSKNIALSICFTVLLLGCSESNIVSKPNLNFSVISDEKKENIKRVVSVELDERLDEGQLKMIAEYLKSIDANYENIFIAFRVKGENRQAYWADASFTPDVKVTILGSDIEEEKQLQEAISKYQLSESSELIGKWMNRSAYDSAIIFYKKNGQILSDEIFASGVNISKFTEKSDEHGLYFKKEDSSDGYRINQDGTMEIFNAEEKRKILTMYPIEK